MMSYDLRRYAFDGGRRWLGFVTIIQLISAGTKLWGVGRSYRAGLMDDTTWRDVRNGACLFSSLIIVTVRIWTGRSVLLHYMGEGLYIHITHISL